MEAIEIRSPVDRKGISGLRERSGAVTGKLRGKGYFQRKGGRLELYRAQDGCLREFEASGSGLPKGPSAAHGVVSSVCNIHSPSY